MSDRRRILKTFAAAGGSLLVPRWLNAATPTSQKLPEYPFTLGVASGYPTDRSVVLWTRLAPKPAQGAGGLPAIDWRVRYEVASDENFRDIIARGDAVAESAFAHSVHVEVPGLSPERHYWYRFTAGGHVSPVGRTRTLPSPEAKPGTLRLISASCQHYEQGHYAAWRHAAADAPDLVLFLGDYIYESPSKTNHVRLHTGGVPLTLDEFRQRYALYKSDPALQAAHAAAPWLAVWDDHDVQNDYAGIHPGHAEDPAVFLARRAAGYQAWYEHLPLPRSMAPRDGVMRIYTRHDLGSLATLHMIDQRQYRSAEACGKPPIMGGVQVGDECREIFDPARTLLGAEQEQWLQQGLAASHAPWTLLGQGTPLAHMDQKPGEGHLWWTDGTTGYPVARQRMVDTLRETRAPNPVSLAGDFHAFVVAGINAVPEQLDTPLVAAEFTTTSISSNPLSQALYDSWVAENPNLARYDGTHRGYVRIELTGARLRADLVTVDDSSRPDSGRSTSASYVVEAGNPAILPA